MSTNVEFHDVDVMEANLLDGQHARQLRKPWLVVYANGEIVECASEDEACDIQRAHRIKHGRNPMTGKA